MALELNKLTNQVEVMGQTIASRRADHARRVEAARVTLRDHPQVTAELREKIRAAQATDEWRRGAEPLGDWLDERYTPTTMPPNATLIATDGSQIYPDRHGIATYFLLNTGSIVLRQGSGEAPAVSSDPQIFFRDADLYDASGQLRDVDYVNNQRDRSELAQLADLAVAERDALGGDLSRPILGLIDGPLLPWLPKDSGQGVGADEEIRFYAGQLKRLRDARALPVGYVDRPASAYVLRILELIDLPVSELTRDRLRYGAYLKLTDRLLFADLAPNQRTGLFAATSVANERFQQIAGYRIAFFYLNVARHRGQENSAIARVEIPEWVAQDATLLDWVQHIVYADAGLTGYPYVLARAHELAVVSNLERAEFDEMLGRSMLRNRLIPETSLKARTKRWLKG